MVLQNYQNFMGMASNMIYIVALGVGLKCLRKIHLNTQCHLSMKQFFSCFTEIPICPVRTEEHGSEATFKISFHIVVHRN